MNRDDVEAVLFAAGWCVAEEVGSAFELVRHEDVSGVSGTGVVADGIEFENGTVVLCWHPPYDSIAVWPSLDKLLGAHGHQGKTVVHWLDEEAG